MASESAMIKKRKLVGGDVYRTRGTNALTNPAKALAKPSPQQLVKNAQSSVPKVVQKAGQDAINRAKKDTTKPSDVIKAIENAAKGIPTTNAAGKTVAPTSKKASSGKSSSSPSVNQSIAAGTASQNAALTSQTGQLTPGDIGGEIGAFLRKNLLFESDNPDEKVFASAGLGTGAIGSAAKGLAGTVARAERGVLGKLAASSWRSRWADRALTNAGKLGTMGLPTTTALEASGAIKIAANTKTQKLTQSLLSKIITPMVNNPKATIFAISSIIGTYPFAEWAGLEGDDTLSMSLNDAIKTKDPALIQQVMMDIADAENPSIWSSIGRLLPGTNLIVGFGKKADAIATQWTVADYRAQQTLDLLNDPTLGTNAGVGSAADWAQRDQQKANLEMIQTDFETRQWNLAREEQAQMEKENIDYYNSERLRIEQELADAEDRDMMEDAAFWRKEREAQMKREEEDRIAIAKFWEAYRKQQQKYYDDSRPSKLNFGLI